VFLRRPLPRSRVLIRDSARAQRSGGISNGLGGANLPMKQTSRAGTLREAQGIRDHADSLKLCNLALSLRGLPVPDTKPLLSAQSHGS
jgi:hypothetical protein